MKLPVYFYNELFETEYHILYGWKYKDLKRFLDKYIDGVSIELFQDEDGDLFSGCCVTFSNKESRALRSYIIWTESKKLDVLIHEISHATLRTFEFYDIPLVDETSEVISCHNAMLFRVAMKKVFG